jgi:hypothetical protein
VGSFDDLIRDLRGFDRRREIVKALSKAVRKPVPAVRRAIKARAVEVLPSRGGLNDWVASARITAAVKLTGRSAAIRLKGGRNSRGGRSDIKAIDAGFVRAPSWGKRTEASWHTQTVPAGFFTKPVSEAGQWVAAADQAVDAALEQLRRG